MLLHEIVQRSEHNLFQQASEPIFNLTHEFGQIVKHKHKESEQVKTFKGGGEPLITIGQAAEARRQAEAVLDLLAMQCEVSFSYR